MGHHQLPCRQRDHPADHRLADRASRAPQLLPAVDRRLHPRLRAVWHGHESRPTDPVPRDPGPCRRWSSAVEPGRAAGRLPGRAARHGHDAVRPGRADRARRRSDARRLDHRQLLLAVGVLDQRPRRPPGPGCMCPHTPGSRLPHGTAHGVAQATVQLRRRWPVAAGHRHRLLGGDAQQGPGMGLAGRPVLACADAGDLVRRGPGRADLLGTAPSQSGGQFPAVARTEFRRLLHHHLLRLRGAVCCQHLVACLAPVAVRLRCTERRTGHVAGRLLCRRRHADRGARARPWNRCAVGDCRGSA